jgi:hypothetical protein
MCDSWLLACRHSLVRSVGLLFRPSRCFFAASQHVLRYRDADVRIDTLCLKSCVGVVRLILK